MKIPVILDVDTGIDDALAILLAQASNQLDILGISTVDGNVPLKNTFENTQYVAQLLDLSVPVIKGKEKPLLYRGENAAYAHGENGLGNISLTNFRSNHHQSSANLFEFYKETLENASNKVVIIATGPLTNLAAVLVSMPYLKEKIQYISIMGGAIEHGNTSACAEFNIYYDPESASIVFNSGVDIVLAPLDITYQAYITQEEIERAKQGVLQYKQPFIDMLEYYIDYYKNKTRLAGAVLHDSVSVAYVLEPSLFESKKMHGYVDTSLDITRGVTILDQYDTLKKTKNIQVLTAINREKFVELTINSLNKR